MLKLQSEHLEEIKRHAEEGFPHEICGILLGTIAAAPSGHPEESLRIVQKIIRAANLNTQRAADRYDLDPKDQIRAEREARMNKWEVLGFYHSHPNHPCQASQTDYARSWEAYSYLIVSVRDGKAQEQACWIRNPKRQSEYFIQEDITIEDNQS